MVTTANRLVLSDLTMEVEDFVAQFNAYLETKPVWKGQLVTQTSQTLIELISTVGTFDQATLLRAEEDAFAETAQSDDAVRAITSMQGLRLTRMMPAEIEVVLTAPASLTLDPYTQFVCGGTKLFNREQVNLVANVPSVHRLLQGDVKTWVMSGNETDYQSWVSPEGDFSVSDTDVQVRINGTLIPRTHGVMWNYRDQPAYADLTLPDGRLLVQFGNAKFGSVPGTNDEVAVTYAVTDGSNSNNLVLLNRKVSVDGFAGITGTVVENPSGGSGVKDIVVYKNVASGAFGTYESAVTKAHYVATVSTYPGIIDAVTQAQREINPMDLNWMNVIRVSAITNSPWTQAQINDFLGSMQNVTMYAPHFVWFEPQPVDRDVEVEVYIFNTASLTEAKAASERAVQKLFAAKPGILMTNFYESDIDTAIKIENKGGVSYVKLVNPIEGEFIVTLPPSPVIIPEYLPGAGNSRMTPSVYAYCVQVVTAEEVGLLSKWAFPQITNAMGTGTAIKLNWPGRDGVLEYRIFGRQGGNHTEPIGLMATIPHTGASTYTWTDDGSVTPTGGLPLSMGNAPIKYNRLRNLEVKVYYADRQRRLDGSPERKILDI